MTTFCYISQTRIRLTNKKKKELFICLIHIQKNEICNFW